MAYMAVWKNADVSVSDHVHVIFFQNDIVKPVINGHPSGMAY